MKASAIGFKFYAMGVWACNWLFCIFWIVGVANGPSISVLIIDQVGWVWRYCLRSHVAMEIHGLVKSVRLSENPIHFLSQRVNECPAVQTVASLQSDWRSGLFAQLVRINFQPLTNTFMQFSRRHCCWSWILYRHLLYGRTKYFDG